MQALPNDKRSAGLWRAWGPWLAVALIAGCGGAEALIVPFFTFGFTATSVGGVARNVFLNLNPNQPTTDSGPFTSGSSITLDPDPSLAVTGSYAGCTLTITVAGAAAPLATGYSGRFISRDVIELTPTPAPSPTVPVLTFTRAGGNSDPRPTTC